MRKDRYTKNPVREKVIILTKLSSSQDENNRRQEATSGGVACNSEAVLPRPPEKLENQKEHWDQEHAISAARWAVGRSNTQRQEQIGDLQQDHTQWQYQRPPSMSDGTQSRSRGNNEKIRQPLWSLLWISREHQKRKRTLNIGADTWSDYLYGTRMIIHQKKISKVSR